MPEQVQDFYPTPSTKSTCMYYTGLDPDTMQPVYVPKSPLEKKMQRALMQYRKKSNYAIVREALVRAGREDLIGPGERCLIPYTAEEQAARRAAGQHAPKAGKQGKPSRIPQTGGEKMRGARQKKGNFPPRRGK